MHWYCLYLLACGPAIAIAFLPSMDTYSYCSHMDKPLLPHNIWKALRCGAMFFSVSCPPAGPVIPEQELRQNLSIIVLLGILALDQAQ